MILQILNMSIDFTPQFNQYFHQQMELFHSSNPPVYYIHSQVVQDIHVKGDKKELNNGEILYVDDQFTSITKTEHGHLMYALKKFDHHYDIQINENSLLKAEIEYVLSSRVFAHIASMHRYLILHASAVSYQKQGILLAGASGIGKTTFAKRLMKHDKDAFFINDDKPLIAYQDNVFYVHGTPWAGTQGLSLNTSKTLNAILFLCQGKVSHIEPLTNKEKVLYVIEHTHRMFAEDLVDDYMRIVDRLINDVPIFKMTTTNSDEDILCLDVLIKKGFKMI